MIPSTRRDFLAQVGGGMLSVVMGPALMRDIGLASVSAAEPEQPKKTPSALERLTESMIDTPTTKILPVLKEQLDKGVTLREMIAAGALANVRSFGGQDYQGYHTFMALAPAWAMAEAMPEEKRALPIFKVLYRNSRYIQDPKHRYPESFKPVEPAKLKSDPPASKQLLDAVVTRKYKLADSIATARCRESATDTYEDVQLLVQDELNVHRTVLAWRSWEMLDFTGREYAESMLRQTVLHCATCENHLVAESHTELRTVMPPLLEKYKLLERKSGTRKMDDETVEKLYQTIYTKRGKEAAGAVAEMLGEGFAPDQVAEAIALAATQLVLGDSGRNGDKERGSVHGDSVGVHASDAANAWRHIARVTSPRNTFASLIASAYNTAAEHYRQMAKAHPFVSHIERIKEKEATDLLKQLEEAIRLRDQATACALTACYGELKLAEKDVFALLRRYAITEDGSLHGEKYYNTAVDEFSRTRTAFRWRHAVALARVTASASGKPGGGVEETKKLFKIETI